MSTRTQKEVQRERTRRKLLDVARKMFSTHGYTDTSAEEIAERVGVTRGALYYHFRDKRELFKIVCEELEDDCCDQIARAVLAVDRAEDQARAATRATLDAFLDPTYARVVIREGPAALGWTDWHEIMSRFSRQQLRRLIEVAMGRGLIEQRPPQALAAVIVGAVNEAAVMIAESPHPKRTRNEFEQVIAAMLDGLLFDVKG